MSNKLEGVYVDLENNKTLHISDKNSVLFINNQLLVENYSAVYISSQSSRTMYVSEEVKLLATYDTGLVLLVMSDGHIQTYNRASIYLKPIEKVEGDKK